MGDSQDYIIRLIQGSDFKELYQLIERNRNRLLMYFPKTVNSIQDMQSANLFVTNKTQEIDDKISFFFVIVVPSNNKVLGCIIIKDIDWSIPKGEFAYFIDSDMERKGIISSSLKYVISYCFDHLGFEKIFVRINPTNISSKRVAQKCGFIKEGYLRKDFRSGSGTIEDSEYHSLLR